MINYFLLYRRKPLCQVYRVVTTRVASKCLYIINASTLIAKVKSYGYFSDVAVPSHGNKPRLHGVIPGVRCKYLSVLYYLACEIISLTLSVMTSLMRKTVAEKKSHSALCFVYLFIYQSLKWSSRF